MVCSSFDSHFCSECKYSREVETENAIKIICCYEDKKTTKSIFYQRNFVYFKKLNARACSRFSHKDADR